MAAQTQDARVVLQPTQQEAPPPVGVFGEGAQTLGQVASVASQESRQQEGMAARYGQMAQQGYAKAINFASSAFDQVLSTYNKYAEQKAIEDAPALIKRDGNGQLIPPSSFYPPGISTRAYGEPFANTAIALYKSYAEQELIQHAAVLKEKYPTDSPAFIEGMKIKRQAMMQGLDPRVAPWMEVRAEQVQAQGVTQIAVAVQSEQNVRTKQQYDLKKQGIVDDAARMAAASPIGQGGGGSQAGYDNNPGNITTSGDPYHGGKGLPYASSNGRKFETFGSAEEGVAASHNLIKKKVDAAGGTLTFNELIGGRAGVVKGWDEGADLQVKLNYAKEMAAAAGLKPDDVVPIGDNAAMAKILKAQNKYEKGKYTVSDAAFDNGVKLATGDKGVPRTQLATGAVTIADPKQLAQAADAALNTAAIAERINDLRILGKSQGKTDEQINHEIRETIQVPAQLRAMGEQIRNSSAALYIDGNVQPGAVAAADDRIRQIAALPQFRGREQEVISTLRGYLQEAQTQASRQAAQVQTNDQRASEPAQRKMMADAAAAKLAALNGDSVTAATITRDLETRSRSYLTDTTISDSVAMKMSSIAAQNGAISRGALQEANSNRINAIQAIVSDPTMSQDKKAMAYENAKGIRNDVDVWRDLTTGQRQGVQATMDNYVHQNFATQLAAFEQKILTEPTSPTKIAEVRAMQVEKGILQPQDLQRATMVDMQAAKLFNEREMQSKLAVEATENHRNGRTNTAEQAAALEKEVNPKPPGNAPSWNLGDGTHVARAQEIYQKYGLMPAGVKAALDAITYSPDEAVAAGPKALFETIRQAERQRVEKVTGKLHDPDQDAMVEHNVAAIVGKSYNYLAIATRNGALPASKVMLDEGSKAGALGQTADQSKSSMQQSLKNMEALLSRSSLNPITQAIIKPLGAFDLLRSKDNAGWLEKRLGLTSDEAEITAGMTPEQRAVRAAASITGLGVTDTIMGSTGLTNRGKFDNVVIEPGYGKHLLNNATIHLATDGHAIRTVRPNGSAEDFVVGTALADSIRKGEASATVSADGKTITYGFKTLGAIMQETTGIPMSPKMEQGAAAAILATERTRTGGALSDTNPDNTYARSYQAPNGQMRIHIAELDRNGNAVRAMDLAKDDPRISIQAIATIRAASDAIITASYVPERYAGAPEATVGLTGVAGPTGRVAWPMEKMIRWSTMVGGVVQELQVAVNRPGMTAAMLGEKKLMTPSQLEAQKNMQGLAGTMLQQLNDEFKNTKDAPNLAAVLTHMMENHAPGFENNALRQMIKDAGYYQPGRLPQVQTGPSRIGTERR